MEVLAQIMGDIVSEASHVLAAKKQEKAKKRERKMTLLYKCIFPH